MTVIRNKAGQPFSKWKPAEKFRYKLMVRYPDLHSECVDEYQFDPERKWRLDFAWPTLFVGVEIDGFGYGHQAQQCMAEDNEKANRAVELEWKVFRFNSRQLGSIGGVEDAVVQVCEFICTATRI